MSGPKVVLNVNEWAEGRLDTNVWAEGRFDRNVWAEGHFDKNDWAEGRFDISEWAEGRFAMNRSMNWAQGRLEHVVLHCYVTSVFDIIHWAIAHAHSCVCR